MFMLKWIHHLDDRLLWLERGLAVALFTLLIGIICLNIVARNFLQMTSHRLIELAPAMVLWLALVGATLALKHQRHIRIELLLRFLPPVWRRLAIVATSLFAMTVSGVLAYAAFVFVHNEIILFGAWGWLAICFPLFFLTAFFRFGVRLLNQIIGRV